MKYIFPLLLVLSLTIGAFMPLQAQKGKVIGWILLEGAEIVIENAGSIWDYFFGEDYGFVSMVTDRRNGINVYIDGKYLSSIVPQRHANYKVEAGVYELKAIDKRNSKRIWMKTVRIKEGEITEIYLTKEISLKARKARR